MKLEFSRQSFENTQMSNFMKLRPVAAELFLTDRHDEANSSFSLFCESAPKLINLGERTAVVQTSIHRSTLTGKQGVLSPAVKCTDEGQLRHEFITGWRQFSANGKYATCRVQDEDKGNSSVLTKPLTGENAIVWGTWNTRNGQETADDDVCMSNKPGSKN